MQVYIQSRINRCRYNFYKVSLICILGCLLSTQPMLTKSAPVQVPLNGSALQTLGDFLSLGANTVREIKEAIPLAGSELRNDLQFMSAEIEGILSKFKDTFKDNVNVALTGFDNATKDTLFKLQAAMDSVNEKIQEDIHLISAEAQNVIRTARQQIQAAANDLEKFLTKAAVIGSETLVYIVDSVIADIFTLACVIILGIGLIVIIVALLKYWSKTPPLVFFLISFFIAVFTLLTFIPPLREFTLSRTGIGLQEKLAKVTNEPKIYDVNPETILLGKTRSIQLWGTNLLLGGSKPIIKIGGQIIQGVLDDKRVVINVENLNITEGATNVVLTYPTKNPADKAKDFELTKVIQVEKVPPPLLPADLVVTGYEVSPATPVASRAAEIAVFVANRGQTLAKAFVIRWSDTPGAPGQPMRVENLGPNDPPRRIAFPVRFANPSNYETSVDLDVNNEVDEGNGEGNNHFVRVVAVNPIPVVHLEMATGCAGEWPDGGGDPGRTMNFPCPPLEIPQNCSIDTSRGGSSFEVDNIDNPNIKYTITYPAGFIFDFKDFTFWRSIQAIKVDVANRRIIGNVTLKGLGGHGIFANRGAERFNSNFIVLYTCPQ